MRGSAKAIWRCARYGPPSREQVQRTRPDATSRSQTSRAFRGLSFRSEAEVRACVSVLAMHTGRTLQSYSMDVSVALKYARPALRKRTVMDRLVGEHGLEDLVHRPVGLCVVCLGFEGIPFCTWPNAPEKETAEIWLHTPSVYVSEATNSGVSSSS